VLDPATLQPVGQVGLCDETDVQAAIDAATAAQKHWRLVDAKSRAARLHQLANAIEQDVACNREVARLMTLEMGKPFPEAMGELANCAPIFRYYAEMARDDAGKVAGTTQIGSFQHVRYEPYGVSVHIMPFNFPILLMCWTVAASLAAGNACIVKPAEATTLCTLVHGAFHLTAAGADVLRAGRCRHRAVTGEVSADPRRGLYRQRRRWPGGCSGVRAADETLCDRGRGQRPVDHLQTRAAGGGRCGRRDCGIPSERTDLHLGGTLLRGR
jgi:acyl-CoA reductase-like NAD-dependent aldehyde dehydrogenase